MLPADFKVHPIELDKFTLGYICGIVDGEGSIGFQKRKDRKKRRGYAMKIQVANDDHSLLKWLKAVTDLGNVYAKGTKSYAWYITRITDAASFLKTIIPHLKVKDETAKLMLHFLMSRIEAHKKSKKPPYTKEEETLIRQVYELNGRSKLEG